MTEKLPPGTVCAVCDDIATGKHYSVASCNGCKTFFRRALVNKREFICQGNKNCPVNKGVRCACRYCRLQKCLAVGMDKNSIQNDRDRIGYTKRKRKHDDDTDEPKDLDLYRDGYERSPQTDGSHQSPSDCKDYKADINGTDPIAERLATLENNFTLLLSRCSDIRTYTSIDDALDSPSRFLQPITCDWTDPLVHSVCGEKMPFWRQRLISLYIDWAKTFSVFRSLPHSDKVAMVTNHASSFMIMCEAFRTPEHIKAEVVRQRPDLSGIVSGSESGSSRVPSSYSCSGRTTSEEVANEATHLDNIQKSINEGIKFGEVNENMRGLLNETYMPVPLKKIKSEPRESPEYGPDMIRLPTEYGSLPADYASWIPKDYGHPTAGHEGRSDVHNFFDAREFCRGSLQSRPSSCNFTEQAKKTTLVVPICNSEKIPEASVSGITPILTMMLDLIMKPFRQLNISTTEFALLQAIMFFDPDTENLDSASQRNVIAEQKKYLSVLYRHLQKAYNPEAANDRYASILLRIPTVRRAAAKKNESLQVLDMLQLYKPDQLLETTALGPRPTKVQQMMGIGGGAGGVLTFLSDPNIVMCQDDQQQQCQNNFA